MAKYANINPSMDAREARKVSAKGSWIGAGIWYLDPLQEEPIELDIQEESHPLTHPSVANQVLRYEKKGLLKLGRDQGVFQGSIRAPKTDDPMKEWDHVTVTFSADEMAMYREMSAEDRLLFRRTMAEGLTDYPEPYATKHRGPGRRQAFFSTLHKDDDGSWHYQAIIHRHAVGVNLKKPDKPDVKPVFDISRSSELNSMLRNLNDKLVAAGFAAFHVEKTHAPDADFDAMSVQREEDEPEADADLALHADGDKAEAEADAEEKPKRRPDQAPEPAPSLIEQARHMTTNEDVLRKMAEKQRKRLADAQRQLEAEQDNLDGFMNLLAAEVQKNEAIRERDAAKAAAEEAAMTAVAAQAEANEAKAAAEAEAKARKAAEEIAEEQERLAKAANDKLIEANTEIGELRDAVSLHEETVNDLKEEHEAALADKDAELEALRQQVEALNTELSDTHGHLEAAEKKATTQANRADKLEGELKDTKIELSGAKQAMENLRTWYEDELKSRVAAAVEEATNALKATHASAMDALHEKLGRETQAKIDEAVSKAPKGDGGAEQRKFLELLRGSLVAIFAFREKQQGHSVKRDYNEMRAVAEVYRGGKKVNDLSDADREELEAKVEQAMQPKPKGGAKKKDNDEPTPEGGDGPKGP